MVETVDHILFIIIFTFMSHVFKTLFYTLNLSLYLCDWLSSYIYLYASIWYSLSISLIPSIHLAPNTQYSFYTGRSALGAHLSVANPGCPLTNAWFVHSFSCSAHDISTRSWWFGLVKGEGCGFPRTVFINVGQCRLVCVKSPSLWWLCIWCSKPSIISSNSQNTI